MVLHFYLKLWAKNYDKKKCRLSNFPSVILSQGKGWGKEDLVAQGGKSIGKFDPWVFFCHKFSLTTSNWKSKTILDIYIWRAFQWCNLFLFEQHFSHELSCQIFKNLFPKVNCSPRQLSWRKRQFPSSLGRSQLSLFSNFNFFLDLTFNS